MKKKPSRIWIEITYNGWYAIKSNQMTNQPTIFSHIRVKGEQILMLFPKALAPRETQTTSTWIWTQDTGSIS